MLTVLTLLRSGGDFKREHFDTLKRRLDKFITVDHEVFCLTDTPEGPNDIPLRHNWPGWWSKMEVFRPLGGWPTLYIDLDMLVISNIDDIVLDHKFTQLRHFRLPDSPKPNSGLMAWDCDLSRLYYTFAADAERYMKEYANGGDEAFIRDNSPIPWDKWQEKFPGRVLSYKMDCKDRETGEVTIPEEASIICFHGPPRPWATPLWSEYAI